MAKVLVLGGDGFIGSHLIDDLLTKGHDVRAFGRFYNGKSFNLEHLRDKIEFFCGDFLNLADINEALKGVEYVFHMISLSTPVSTIYDPLLDVETNIHGTIQLLDLCVKNNIKKVIFPSSGGTIYGNTDIDLISEDHPTNPFCPYGISKLAIEKYLDYFYKLYGLDYLIFRVSNPYGARQSFSKKQGVIAIFLNLIKQGKSITIFGNGEDVRDYIYVKDVSTLWAEIFNKETVSKIYNVGFGKGYSINDIVKIMKNIVEKEIRLDRAPERKGDVNKVVLDICRLKNEFSFLPSVTFEEGIKKTWEYIKNSH